MNNDRGKAMTDLTEQWKKGELPSGWFWVEGCRDKEIYAYTSEYLNHMYRPKNSDRIIEQVPSYDEWKALNGNMDSVMQTNQALCKKLAELKELLKECKGIFDECFSPSVKYGELYKQIDEVLK